jgi:hypothetical protein
VSTPELEALFEQAIVHVNAGELQEGRSLLERVLEEDPKNDQAWVWLSGCVEDPMQRRICLQQALAANPTNQAALDGMMVLEGKLIRGDQVPPSLLESRLSSIGMSEQAPGAEVSPPPSPEATTVSPPEPGATEAVEPAPVQMLGEEMAEEPEKKRGGRRIILLVAVLLFLFVIVCIVAGLSVVPSLLSGLTDSPPLP